MAYCAETELEKKMKETILDNAMQIRLLNKQIKKLSLSKTRCCEEITTWVRNVQQIIEQAGEDLLLELNENITSLEVPMDTEKMKIDGSRFPGNMKFMPNLDLPECLSKAGLGVILSGNEKTDFLFRPPPDSSSNVIKQECNDFNKVVINEDFIKISQLGQNLKETVVVKQSLVDIPPLLQNSTRSSRKGESRTPLKISSSGESRTPHKISSSLTLPKLDPPKQNPRSIEFPIDQSSIPRSKIVRNSDGIKSSNLFLRTLNTALTHNKKLDKQMMKKKSVEYRPETFEKTHQNVDVNVRDIEHTDIVLNNTLKVENIDLLNNNDPVYSQSSPKKEEMKNKSRNWFTMMKSIRQSRGSSSTTNVSQQHSVSLLSYVGYDNLNVSDVVNNLFDPTGLAVLPDSSLLVVSCMEEKVRRYSREGEFLDCLSSSRELRRPTEIHVMSRTCVVVVVDSVGIMLWDQGQCRALGHGTVNQCVGLAEDRLGRIVTINYNNEMEANGSVTSPGQTDVLFLSPDTGTVVRRVELADIIDVKSDCRGLAIYQDMLIIVDHGLSCLYVLPQEGEGDVEIIRLPGPPSCVLVDNVGSLVVAINDKLLVLNSSGLLVGEIMVSQSLSSVSSLCLDRDELLVCCQGDGSVRSVGLY